MFSWRRKLPTSSKVAFLAAGVCAVTAFVLVQAQVARGRDAGLGPTVGVVAAARDLPAGVTLTAQDLTVIDLPSSLVPAGAYAGGVEVPAVTTITPFRGGEPLTDTRLAQAGGELTASVPPGMVAFTLVPDQAPAGIGPGDRVDVYATYATARPYTAVIATDVEVIATSLAPGDVAGGGGPGGGGAGALTVITDPFTAQDLARADATATVAVAVRGFVPLGLTPDG